MFGFLEDTVKTIVKIEDIKRFRPKDIQDFTEGKAFMVKWGDDNDEDEFYKAQILKLGGTMEEVKNQLSKSRVRFPVMYDTSVDATTEEDDDVEVERLTLAKEKKEKRKQTSKATTSSLRSMLGQRLKEKEDAPLFSSTPKKRGP
ncbi:putative BEN domain-containing protein 5-like isoform X1 [Apostichopus japonicus]|uniref:Putative BEN domain-containing protein 5-like isoform X1 n=1 Tax=Stichopus japonicus TaxID=307972 RepID=A0A2G8JRG7_STIJA|nr:putative BEN domain-containing protein 5-like isoform X1 [Apostichopus japonicus]